ncbi:MgtC/SapB family protein [Gallaecimonas kandeliae]|uniref:MgtC/SapB family protein n=1 Tax=Gallaecimonas kandeliae TaxID=3029055 RepID=UPI00264A42D9|nr:MgtC/SapB family protein [Gallaecimonas kandeliae]WKE64316.1 MgtC/SapB family protein [Gallaecimonas kandeliae]
MNASPLVITLHLLAALLAGGLIGLERSLYARPAGLRTHMLVCLASCLLMLVTLYQAQWLPAGLVEEVRTDPTRMAQGIMTGIGFLGAGVIFKDHFTIRGLTTAATIWTTAAIGILIGIGFYVAALIATPLTLAVLVLLRWLESRLPSQSFAHFVLRFERRQALAEDSVRELLAQHGFTVLSTEHRTSTTGLDFEYRMLIRTDKSGRGAALAESLRQRDDIKAFRISPLGE